MKNEKRVGVDVGYHQDKVHTVRRSVFGETSEPREIIPIASQNIVVTSAVARTGKNAEWKWYLKKTN